MAWCVFILSIMGLINGVYQVVEDITAGIRNRYVRRCFSRRLLHTVATFLLVTFAWLFFRAGSLEDSYTVLKDMISTNNWIILFDGSLYNLGVVKNYMNVLLVSILVLFLVDYYKYKGMDVAKKFLEQDWYFKVMSVMAMIFAVLLYGCYGEQYDIKQVIYFQF